MSATAGLVFGQAGAARAQQPLAGRAYRIGFLSQGKPPTTYIEALQQGLRELGYSEGQNLVWEFRSTDGGLEPLPQLAEELVRAKADLIDDGSAVLTKPLAVSEVVSRSTPFWAASSAPDHSPALERRAPGGLAMFKRIDHVELVTDELDRAVEFYTEVLGFRVRSRDRIERSSLGVPMHLTYLDLGDTTIELIWYEGASVEPAPRNEHLGYRLMALEVDDMQKTLEYLKTKAVEPVWGPRVREDYARAEIEDPSGHRIELRQWFR